MAITRVLVAEDSITVRRMLVELLTSDPAIEVVGEAEDGSQAVELCRRLRPDVVTMDMMMPHVNGLQATEHIMAHFPTPILIVSASVNRAELFRTYDALAAGALDVIEKPLGEASDGGWSEKFLAAVKLVSRIRVITHLRGKIEGRGIMPVREAPRDVVGSQLRDGHPPRCIAIGVSTGGPSALVDIFREMPSSFTIPIFVVIHIASAFGAAFADWLGSHSKLPVAYAVDGERLPERGQGRVILAPPDRHLVLRGGKLRLTLDPERHSCRPSVDVLFESLARELPGEVAAALLTGMGKDGALGLLEVRRSGGKTYAQDEATSVIFGMPREAILIGAAERVLPLPDFASTFVDLEERR